MTPEEFLQQLDGDAQAIVQEAFIDYGSGNPNNAFIIIAVSSADPALQTNCQLNFPPTPDTIPLMTRFIKYLVLENYNMTLYIWSDRFDEPILLNDDEPYLVQDRNR